MVTKIGLIKYKFTNIAANTVDMRHVLSLVHEVKMERTHELIKPKNGFGGG